MMNKHIKNNIYLIIIVMGLSLFTNLFAKYSYMTRRPISILCSIVELLFVYIMLKKEGIQLRDIGLRLLRKTKSWVIGLGICLLSTILMIILNNDNLQMMF